MPDLTDEQIEAELQKKEANIRSNISPIVKDIDDDEDADVFIHESPRVVKKKPKKPAATVKRAPKMSGFEMNYDFYTKHYLESMKSRQEQYSFSYDELDKYLEDNPGANLVYSLPLFHFMRAVDIKSSKCFYDKERKAFSLYTESGIEYLAKLQKTLAKKKKTIDPFLIQKFSKTWWRMAPEDSYKIRAAFDKGKTIIVTMLGFNPKPIRSGDGEFDTIVMPRLRFEGESVDEVEEPEIEQDELAEERPAKKRKRAPRKSKKSEEKKEELPSEDSMFEIDVDGPSWIAFCNASGFKYAKGSCEIDLELYSRYKRFCDEEVTKCLESNENYAASSK